MLGAWSDRRLTGEDFAGREEIYTATIAEENPRDRLLN